MDLMDLFRYCADFFLKFCSVTFVVAGYRISVASVFIFAGLTAILIKFIKGLGD